MIPARLVLATANPGKVRELGALVREWGAVELMDLAACPGVVLPEETGDTYAANAVAKAQAVALATGLPALADDSGLEVDALGGAPGVRSARWAATDGERIAKLLAALDLVPDAARSARFRAVVALAWPDGRVTVAEGLCEGWIARVPAGSGGFGYDPVFVPEGYAEPFAALPASTKRALSHRARALRALGARLAAST
ncbi:MAG: RdgB/HAM1 family non-canonical purine NTP pyrophosphatase [Candidatus Binatia bacterium]